ncbi:aminoacyl-tRNA hydrolase [Dietzia sp. UBA5065]|uniref:aminoacyl-tRNA hydrolase n=1 Tax=Dietzia sp. UBA5065 TaxID=1946422 RepID=UPI0025C3963E|nr:aminoacyl-tRNA hydrolase [Dietzia sp. UBA5065]HMT48526.1 aminoacyl-tRNA hydrolase [Dietzia sp.]
MIASGAALDWCHARLREGSAGAEDPDDRTTIRSMPIVLHLPRAEPPGRTPLLEAVAGAVAALCLDERVAPGGPWHPAYAAWLDARMRKIARRARGAQWQAALEVPGVTREVAGCVARAFVPGPVDEVDPRLGRLQIGGTDLDRDRPGPPPAGVPVIWIDGALAMTVGKAAAQVGHGVMLSAASMDRARLDAWIAGGLPVAVREADPGRWGELSGAVAARVPGVVGVVDAGYTEVAPGSVTVIAEDGGRAASGVAEPLEGPDHHVAVGGLPERRQ